VRETGTNEKQQQLKIVEKGAVIEVGGNSGKWKESSN
jgi:hypothetical protein